MITTCCLTNYTGSQMKMTAKSWVFPIYFIKLGFPDGHWVTNSCRFPKIGLGVVPLHNTVIGSLWFTLQQGDLQENKRSQSALEKRQQSADGCKNRSGLRRSQ